MFKLTKYALAVMSVIALSACGGGGSSPDDEVTNASIVNIPVYVSAESTNVAGGQSAVSTEYSSGINDVLVCLDENDDMACTAADSVIARVDENGFTKLSWDSNAVADYANKKIIATNSQGLLLQYSLNKVKRTVSAQDSVSNVNYSTLYLSTLTSMQEKYGSAEALAEVLELDQVVDFSTIDTKTNNNYAILQDALYQIGMAFNTTINGTKAEITFLIEGSYAQITKALANNLTKDNIISQIKVAFGEDPSKNPFGNIILPDVENVAPIARFTYSANNLKVTFTNTSTDEDGDILNYVWSFGDGSANEKSTNPVHTYASSGTYKVNLIANDGNKYTSVTIPVTVVGVDGPINHAPKALFDYSVSGLKVTFTNSSTDEDGDLLSFTWNMGDGKTITNSSKSFSYTYVNAANYNVSLVASDGIATGTVSKTVAVDVIVPDCTDGVCSTQCPQNCNDPCASGVCSNECPQNCSPDDLRCTLTE